MNFFRKIIGATPTLDRDDSFSPSPLALKLATADTTDYEPTNKTLQKTAQKPKILVLCTEQFRVPMANGTFFSSGNHPVETLVPMLHLQHAGFDFDIFTPNGRPVQFELWAMPKKDARVQKLYRTLKPQFDSPRSLADFAKNDFKTLNEYVAIFIPGGHGALLGLPADENVGALIRKVHENGLFLLTICHGPAALLAAKPANSEPFIYAGYKIAAFPDNVDKKTPLIGYMPGQLTWFFGEKLQKLGVTIINKKADKTCYVDRKLITGASPKAANEFGGLAAKTLVEYLEN